MTQTTRDSVTDDSMTSGARTCYPPAAASATRKAIHLNFVARNPSTPGPSAPDHEATNYCLDRDTYSCNPTRSSQCAHCVGCIVAGTEDSEYIKIPKTVFTTMLTKTLEEMARPLTRRHAGKKLRQSKTIPFPTEMLEEELTLARGVP